MNIIVSILYWLFFIITILLIHILYLLTYLLTFIFDKKRKIVHFFTRYLALFYLYSNPFIKLDIKSIKEINKNNTYIIISNHQSMLDIFLLYLLPIHFRWISKVEIFKIPIVGTIMKLNKYIPLKRGNKESINNMYQLAEKSLKENISISMFPEATRSIDGKIKKFKEGAFNLSLTTGVPLLPVVIDGTYKIMPKNSIFFNKRETITLRVYKEIKISYNSDIPKIIEKTEEFYKTELTKIRNNK